AAIARARAAAAAASRARAAAAAAAARARAASLARPAGPGLPAGGGAAGSPVAGVITRGFGQATLAGPATGVSFATAPAARVVSPCAGKVVFGQKFRSYGLLLIVDCGGGYDFVMSGMARLDAQVGQSVRAGEPVGVMPGWNPRLSEKRPTLYVELRRNGVPVDPMPWLRRRG
ncbi:MAG: murein hydrolase activator EnvC family protein, partial [Acetobacteraceae bacterium]